MSTLHAISALKQSVWSDQVSRSMLDNGELRRLIDEDGISGVTSNPTIFANAITGSSDYDGAISQLAAGGAGPEAIYAELVKRDIQDACDVLLPIWAKGGKQDGHVSVEVSPVLAHDTEGTVEDARAWWKRVDRQNLLIKVPATQAGLPAIEELIADGISVNVTLIFSLERHRAVIDAYLTGIERLLASGGDPAPVASVASFFVSRFDSEVDNRLTALGTDAALLLRGKTAVANAQAAYGAFLDMFAGERWETLAAAGAQLQRPLWASTSTKNPDYDDLLYVEPLIVGHSVNTMPLATIDAYRDHGDPDPTPFGPGEITAARATLDQLAAAGVDYDDVVQVLEDEGVEKFAVSYRELLAGIEEQTGS
jgi:transaldolase